MGKIRESLTRKMIALVICGFVIAVVVFLAVYYVSSEYADYYFKTSAFIHNAEEKEIGRLQEFIFANDIRADDQERIMDWVESQNIGYITISRENQPIVGISNTGSFTLLGNVQRDLNITWMYFYQVEFADGPADVFIYNGYAEKYYVLVDIIAMFAAVLSYILFVFWGIRKEVRYIVLIRGEISGMQESDYASGITVKGRDEVSALAEQLNRMRAAILAAREKEQALKASQESLLLGMAHDLRTPLTSQTAYLEILRNSDRIVGEERTYAEKALAKAVEIKELSEQLFEYFLTSTTEEVRLEEPCEAGYAVGEYLSELVYLLENAGFKVDTGILRWEPVKVSLYSEYIGRINNNLYSNIVKYADPQTAVKIWIEYRDREISLHLSNAVNPDPAVTSKTGIGLKNVTEMMKRMGGRTEVESDAEWYDIALIFPVVSAGGD
ncbi:MAG: HAMP domain-containing histidine kinase [bacterium]|nr:HAMP domain-containing histidine kinase [bacterium]